MNVDLRYLGRSEAREAAWGVALRLSPNLARPKVFFDAELVHPVRFREAISALHEVVVGDLRFKKRDRSGLRAFKQQQAEEEQRLRAAISDQVRKEALAEAARKPPSPPPSSPELDTRFRVMHSLYWAAWRLWANEVWLTELARHVIAFDPLITVAPDCVFFEAFAKDESSYGCLFVERDAFQGEAGSGLGTTNVDYSPALFDHFQSLRSYRSTRLQVDPRGFEVKVEGDPDLREEKIDLPASWLRGFGQLQAAMALPSRRVSVPVEAVYSVLAFLRRHRERTGPRSLRFQLVPGRVPVLVLDPWGVSIVCHGAPAWDGDKPEEIKVWGRRRLFALARLLPLAERVEVQLLGSGLPSIWNVKMGEMRFVLALSGWTANDWTSGAALEGLGQHKAPPPGLADAVARHLEKSHSASLPVLARAMAAPQGELVGALHQLAKQGQAIYDFSAQAYRWRPAMPVALSESVLGPEPPEVVEGKVLYFDNLVKLGRGEPLEGSRRKVSAWVDGVECEAAVDSDGGFSKARCGCSHFYRFKLRKGPCRHLLALKLEIQFERAVRS
ncbi:MAG: SWIM zinc finger family protein [Deltaproteobacteria bacterium]|nr:SWIM zinc finger family protein [Deltaproteobacteria bacterium]